MELNLIAGELSRNGFAHIKDTSPWINFTLTQQERFCSWWNNLDRDENFRHYTHRERRILRYRSVNDDPCLLEINMDPNFHPKVTYDIKYKQGVNHLSYAEEEFISDAILQKIIHFDQSVVYAVLGQRMPVTMDIHQFRVKAEGGKVSPTTSGIHQDGFDWIFMHFIKKNNIHPVISEIFSGPDEGDLIFTKEMNQYLETLIVNDNQCWHRATSVESLDNQQSGWRDLLLVTCRCFPQGVPV